MALNLDRVSALVAHGRPPLPADVIEASEEARAALRETADADAAAAARALIAAAVAAGSVTWDLRRRQQLRRTIGYWAGVLSERADEPPNVPALAPFDEQNVPQLREGDGEEALQLARGGHPIVGALFEGFPFVGLRAEQVEGEEERRRVKILDCAFRNCTFDRCDLKDARILYSSFTNCTFAADTNLDEAVVTSSLFGRSSLAGVKARNATFAGTRFEAMSMVGAELTWCSFASAEFREVNAEGANFTDSLFDLATLADDADFTGATMERAILTGANVQAKFRDANLKLSIFSSADVHDADFRGADLKEAAFATALGRNYALSDGDLPLGPDSSPS